MLPVSSSTCSSISVLASFPLYLSMVIPCSLSAALCFPGLIRVPGNLGLPSALCEGQIFSGPCLATCRPKAVRAHLFGRGQLLNCG